MQKIITATGKEFQIEWCGQSTIDFALRFDIKGEEMSTIITTFMDQNETIKLIHQVDEMGNRIEYNGFTTFRGVDLKPDGTVVVSLMQN